MALEPKEINQLNVISFQTNFLRLPNVNFFCQKVTIPSLAIGTALQPTLFSDIPVEGDKIVFEQLTISFIVDENITNYLEIYRWLIAMGFPDQADQFNLSDGMIGAGNSIDTLKTDMNVILQTNKSNPNFNFTFKDAFPVTLSSLDLDASATSLEPILATASFAYTGSFSIDKIN
tara:strand:+ start:744 stop:1268 length:525 start_codon:yes stop_codon:yes gene_type:complete